MRDAEIEIGVRRRAAGDGVGLAPCCPRDALAASTRPTRAHRLTKTRETRARFWSAGFAKASTRARSRSSSIVNRSASKASDPGSTAPTRHAQRTAPPSSRPRRRAMASRSPPRRHAAGGASSSADENTLPMLVSGPATSWLPRAARVVCRHGAVIGATYELVKCPDPAVRPELLAGHQGLACFGLLVSYRTLALTRATRCYLDAFYTHIPRLTRATPGRDVARVPDPGVDAPSASLTIEDDLFVVASFEHKFQIAIT